MLLLLSRCRDRRAFYVAFAQVLQPETQEENFGRIEAAVSVFFPVGKNGLVQARIRKICLNIHTSHVDASEDRPQLRPISPMRPGVADTLSRRARRFFGFFSC